MSVYVYIRHAILSLSLSLSLSLPLSRHLSLGIRHGMNATEALIILVHLFFQRLVVTVECPHAATAGTFSIVREHILE